MTRIIFQDSYEIFFLINKFNQIRNSPGWHLDYDSNRGLSSFLIQGFPAL